MSVTASNSTDKSAVAMILTAVLHQLEVGEASDILEGARTHPDSVRDLCWCREQIRAAIGALAADHATAEGR